jgi:hypothetical protein
MKSGLLYRSLKANAEHYLLPNFWSDFNEFVDGICAVKAELESVGYGTGAYISHNQESVFRIRIH